MSNCSSALCQPLLFPLTPLPPPLHLQMYLQPFIYPNAQPVWRPLLEKTNEASGGKQASNGYAQREAFHLAQPESSFIYSQNSPIASSTHVHRTATHLAPFPILKHGWTTKDHRHLRKLCSIRERKTETQT